MHLIVGLGNPGQQYDKTRHNVGFMLLDEMASEAGVSLSQARFRSFCARGMWQGIDCFFMKPQTYMNLSGGPVHEAQLFFKIPPENVVLVFDDLDQDPGAVRMRFGGGHGGHNGVRDVLSTLGTDKFHRLKIGIGKPEFKAATASWVLTKFNSHDLELLEKESFTVAKQRLKETLSRG